MEKAMETLEENIQFLNVFQDIYEKERDKLPYHINLIDELRANENAHSRILVKLLQYKIKNEFTILKSFLTYCLASQKLELKISNPKITAEKHRIDALIIGNGYAVIIENKIHNAIEQPDQIDRYITTIKGKSIDAKNTYIFYLTREGTGPSERSFSGPLKEIYEQRLLKISYRTILDWLKQLNDDPQINKEEFIKSSLLQYIDHLEGIFLIRKADKPMNEEIKRQLKELLQLTDNNPFDNLEILADKTFALEQIQQFVKALESENHFAYWLKMITEDLIPELESNQLEVEKIENFKDTGNKHPSVGIKLIFRGITYPIQIQKDIDAGQCYYGILRVNAVNNSINEEIRQKVQPLDNSAESEHYLIYKYADPKDIFHEFKNLVSRITTKA